MPVIVEMHLADDTLSLYTDLGIVPTGQLSTQVAVKLVNVGDTGVTNMRAWVEGEPGIRYVFEGTLVEGTTVDAPTLLGDLLPGASLSGFIEGLGNGVPLSVAALRIVGD